MTSATASQTIQEHAEIIAIECNGSTDEAVERLKAIISADLALIDECVIVAARQALSRVRGTIRRQVKGQAPRVFSAEMQQAVADGIGRYYRWPLMDGTPLSRASKQQLQRDAAHYERQARGCGVNGRFLRMVADAVPAGKTVAEVLSEEKLAEMMKEAKSRDK